MILVILTAVLAVSGAAKLDRSYLPPISAKTAGGSPGALQAPLDGLPSGSYTNDAQGVVVDAAAPGTRASGAEPTGLGGPRTSYGSTDSKVGDAAFKESLTGFGSRGGPSTRIAPGFGSIVGVDENAGGPSIRIAPGFDSIIAPEGSDADRTRASTLKLSNEIGSENYSYGFETDNGIAVGENGVAGDGIKANGEYSYKGDDGKVYSVSYTADKGGYKPQGSHLPTPPPIPDEIIKSLEQNAKEEAAGIVDDGTYDAQKYNDEGDYTSNNGDGNNKRPSGTGDASGSFVSQGKPNLGVHGSGSQGAQGFGSHASGNKHTGFGLKDQGLGASGGSFGLQGQQGPQFGHNQFGAAPQSGVQSAGPQGGFHSHTTQHRFGVQPVKSDGSSASAIASSGNGFDQGFLTPTGTPTLYSQPGFRLPGSSNGNTAYSSAVTTGSGSASAFASSSGSSSGFGNKPSSNFAPGSKFGPDSTGGASFPDFATANPNEPSSASASATAQGQGASAQALSTSSPSFGSPNFNKVPNYFGSDTYSQNTQSNGLGNEYLPPVNVAGQVPHGSNAHAASSGSQPTSATASASVSGKPSFGQPQAPFGKPNGQSLSSGSHLGSNIPANVIGTFGKPNEQSNLHGSGASPAASSIGLQQPGFPSQSSFNSRPGQYTQIGNAFPTPSGHPQFSNIPPSGVQPSQPASGFPSVPPPTKVPSNELSTPFEPNAVTGSDTGKFPSVAPTQPTIAIPLQQQHNFGSSFPSHSGQYKPQSPQGQGSNDASFSSSTAKPVLTQQQGSDSSYYYNQPSKPFVTPISQYHTSKFQSSSSFGSPAIGSSGQNANNGHPNEPLAQQGSKYSNTPIVGSVAPTPSSQSGQYQGSTSSPYYNGITQASVSPFPSVTPTASTQFRPQSSQVGAQGGSSSQLQLGTTGDHQTFSQKPIVQSQSQHGQDTSSQTDNTQKPLQQGTIYEYNKATSTPGHPTSSDIDSQAKPTQSIFGSQSAQSSNNQFKPFGSSSHTSSYQQPQTQGSTFGSRPNSQFNQNTQTNQGTGSISAFQSQFTQSSSGQKPFSGSQAGSNYQHTQFGSASGSQFGTKPSIQSGSTFQQTQFSSSGSQTGLKPLTSQSQQQNQATIYEYNKPDVTLTSDKEENVENSIKPGSQSSQTSAFSSGQNTPLGVRPSGSSQTSTAFQQSQSTQGSAFGSQQTVQSGQKPQTNQLTGFGSSQTGSTSQQTQFGTPSGSQSQQIKPISQFGTQLTQTQFSQKPQSTQGSGYAGQTSQFGKKPTETGSIFTHSQPTYGSQIKPLTNQPTNFGGSQTGSTFQQNQFGYVSPLGQKPQSNQGSTFTSTGQLPQFGKKPDGTAFTSSTFPQSQTTFNAHTPQTNQVTGFGGSQTSSILQQSQFGSSLSGEKPQSTQGSSFTGTVSTTQSEKKPFGSSQTGSQVQQSVTFGSLPNIHASQKPQINKGSEFSAFAQQSQFSSTSGSQFGQKPQSIGTVFESKPQVQPFSQYGGSNGRQPLTSSSGLSGQPTQSPLLGQKPSDTSTATGSAFSQTQSGSSTQFGQKPQTTQGYQTQTTSFGQKPVTQTGTSFHQTAPGISSGSPSKGQTIQFGQQSFGSSQTTSQFGSSSQATQSTGSTSGTTSQTATSVSQKPFGSSQFGSPLQQTAFSSSFGQPQFGIKPQTTQGSTLTSDTVSKGQAVKPFGSSQKPGSSFSYTQFGSNTGSNTGTVSQTAATLGQQSQIGSYQQSQFGSGSQAGQKPSSAQSTSFTSYAPLKGQSVHTTQFGVKGSSQPTGSIFPQTLFGSGFEQKPGSGLGTGFTNTGLVQPITQHSKKPFGSQSTQANVQQTQSGSFIGTQFGQNIGSQGLISQTTQSGNQPSGSTSGSSFTQAQSATSSGTQFSPKPQSGVSSSSFSTPQVQSISQFGTKPFGSQYTQSQVQQSPFGSFTHSKFGQNADSQGQSIQSGQKSSGSTTGSSYTQTQSTSPTGSHLNQKPQSGSSLTSVITPQVQPISQFNKKPFGSQSPQGSDKQNQFSISPGSQSQNVGQPGQIGQGQYGQKPFGSSQVTGSSFQQSQSGSSISQFGQTPALGTQTSSSTFGQSSQSQFGTQTKKPENTPSLFGSTLGQKPQSSVSAFASSSGLLGSTQLGQASKQQTFGSQSQKPFGSSLTQTAQQQYTQTSSQFGIQSQKPFSNSQSTLQQTQSLGQKPFGNQGSSFQIGQVVDQKTQSTQSNVQTTGVSAQSSSQSAGGVGSFEGYNYQKPQSILASGNQKLPSQAGLSGQYGDSTKPFSTPSTFGSLGQSQSLVGSTQFGVQPTKTSGVNTPFGTQTNQPQFNGQPFKPFSTVGTPVLITTQYGVQPTKPTVQHSGQPIKTHSTPSTQITIEQLQSSAVQLHSGAQPTQGTVASQQPSQTSGAYTGYVTKPNFGSTQSIIPSGLESVQDSSNQGSSVSTVQTPISGLDVTKQPTHSFVGKGEVFGGPREPPKFDEKTGYHY